MSITFNEAWVNYCQNNINQKLVSETDFSMWNKHVISHFDTNPTLFSITPLTLIKFRKTVENKELSPQTVYHCLNLVRRIFNHSIKLGIYSHTVPYFSMPTFDNKRVRFLSKKEAETLLAYLSKTSPLWHDITKFALVTGLRAKEIFTLQGSNINISANLIHVADSKTAKNRMVPINAAGMKIIKKHYSKPNNLLFRYQGRQILRPSKYYLNAVKNTHLNDYITDRREKIVFHSLRHTFASWLVQNGTAIEVVKELLGHTNIQTTLRYAHLLPSQGKQAVLLLDKNIT